MTTVTKDVIRDLLPVYLAGESSDDTRALVEDFLSRDDELRALAEAGRTIRLPDLPQTAQLDSLELASLDRTRRLIGRKMWLLAFSLIFSLLPLTLVFEGGKIVFLMARDQPAVAVAALVVALAGWIAYLDVCRRLSAAGMEPPQTWWARFRWALTGVLLGVPVMLVLRNWTGDTVWLRAIPPVCMFLALRLGERWRQIRKRSRVTS